MVNSVLCSVAYDLPMDERNYLLLKKLGLLLVSLGSLLSSLWVCHHPSLHHLRGEHFVSDSHSTLHCREVFCSLMCVCILRADEMYMHIELYMIIECRLVTNAREWRLRSTVSRTCVVTQTYSTFDNRAFGAAGPGLWNSLPSHLKDADVSYSEFRRSLKTFLFGQWGHCAV